MSLELVPILERMKELYVQPLNFSRFKEYLASLQGDSKDDLQLPIQGFNPMAKEHILEKIEELQLLDAENLMAETLAQMKVELPEEASIKVVLNLADDHLGGWTNRFSTDYESKFKLNALVTRGFATPYFWSSEEYSTELIHERTLESVYRTVYWMQHPRPHTLAEYVGQEIYVARQMLGKRVPRAKDGFEEMKAYLQEHGQEEAYPRVFNFFYGDEASASLGFAKYGVAKMDGFTYARQAAAHA